MRLQKTVELITGCEPQHLPQLVFGQQRLPVGFERREFQDTPRDRLARTVLNLRRDLIRDCQNNFNNITS